MKNFTDTGLQDFEEKTALLSSYPSVQSFDFYRALFPRGVLERLGHQEDHKGNGIAVSISKDADGKHHGELTILTDGLEQLSKLLSHPFPVLAPLSYFGRSRAASHALWMHALAFDIDHVDARGLKNMLHHFDKGLSPTPTYIVNSGHGVHLYYVFKEPLPMYLPAQTALKNLKAALMPMLWNKYTSSEPEKMETLGIVQGFRMVGSQSKLGKGYFVTAYQTGGYSTLDYLNDFVPKASRVVDLTYQSKVSMDEAKEKWPEWYEKRIVCGEQPGRWYVNRNLYDWFKRQMDEHARVGHRYFCMMSLAIYAAKCNIEYDELLNDAQIYQQRLNDLSPGEPFTWDETLKALEAYNENNVKYPRDTMSRISGVPMKENKRNGRSQAQHVKMMNLIRDMDDPDGSWRNKDGRPIGSGTKADLICAYAAEHPDMSNRKIAEKMGVSRNTVNKWLKPGVEKMEREKRQAKAKAAFGEFLSKADERGVMTPTEKDYAPIKGYLDEFNDLYWEMVAAWNRARQGKL